MNHFMTQILQIRVLIQYKLIIQMQRQEPQESSSPSLSINTVDTKESTKIHLISLLGASPSGVYPNDCTLYTNSNWHILLQHGDKSSIYLYDKNFSNQIENIDFRDLPNKHCLTMTAKKNNSKLLVCLKSKIDLYMWQTQQQISDEPSQFLTHEENILEYGEYIVYVSKAINFSREEYYVAYTNKDAFVLITIIAASKRKDVKISCQKIQPLDAKKSWFFWKSQIPHYNKIQILLAKIRGSQTIKMVTLRDHFIHVFELNPSPSNEKKKPTIKQLDEKIIKSLQNIPLVQILPIKVQDQVDGDFSSQEWLQFLSVHSKKFNEDQLTQEIHLNRIKVKLMSHRAKIQDPRQILSQNFMLFQASVLEDRLVLTYFTNVKKFILHSYKYEQFIQKNQEIQDENGEYSDYNKILLSRNSNKSINSLLAIKSNGNVISLCQRIIIQNQQKQPDAQEYQQLQIKVSDERSIRSDPKYRVLKELSKSILKEPQLKSILQRYVSLKLNQELYESHIVDLIQHEKMTSELFTYHILKHVNQYVMKLNNNAESKEEKIILMNILGHKCKDYLYKTINNEQRLRNEMQLYKDTLTYFTAFAPQWVETDLLLPLVRAGQISYVKRLIIQKDLYNPFIYFFVRKTIPSQVQNPNRYDNINTIEFTHETLKQMADKLYINDHKDKCIFKKFLEGLVYQGYEQWQKMKSQLFTIKDTKQLQKQQKQYYQFVNSKMKDIFKALQKYDQYLTPHLDKTYPGISALFFIKKARRHKADTIHSIANKALKPSTAYILNLTTIDVHKQAVIPIIDTNRLCHEIQETNMTVQEFIKTTKQTGKINVQRSVYNQFESTHQQLREELKSIESKINISQN